MTVDTFVGIGVVEAVEAVGVDTYTVVPEGDNWFAVLDKAVGRKVGRIADIAVGKRIWYLVVENSTAGTVLIIVVLDSHKDAVKRKFVDTAEKMELVGLMHLTRSYDIAVVKPVEEIIGLDFYDLNGLVLMVEANHYEKEWHQRAHQHSSLSLSFWLRNALCSSRSSEWLNPHCKMYNKPPCFSCRLFC